MKFSILVSLVLVWSSLSQAVVEKVISNSMPMERMLAENCPWIRAQDVAKVKVMDPQDIGTLGGAVGKILGKLGKSAGTPINTTDISVNLPPETRAILFDIAFYTNGNNAELFFNNLTVIDEAGNQWVAGSAANVLQHESQALLICFVNGERPVVMSTTVSSLNVDGSRPTVGVTLLQPILATEIK